ncbi:MAG: Rrf2 family transcriptional regulator [Lentisphaerae bacterium]|nr:Rrf2 family transcriptional regulator [Lentisphaerota bacterium]
MDIIRKETDYAFRCLVRLAGVEADSVESAKHIAAEESLPEPLLRKILQRLVKSGIVESVKGRSGGVRLARDPHEITLLAVLESVQGAVTLNQCVRPHGCCQNKHNCRLHRCLVQAQVGIDSVLSETTLQNFLD